MMRAVPRWIWIVAVVILSLVGFQCWRSRDQDATADRHVATSIEIDKAHKVQTEASARVDTVVDTVRIREDHYIRVAGSLGKAADTAGQLARTIGDSSAMWHLRWKLRGMQVDTLNLALAGARLRADSLKLDRNRWKGLAVAAVASQDSLRDDLRVARTGCRVLPFVPCLSRKQTLVLGVAAGAAAAWYIEEQRRKKDRQKAPAVAAQVTVLRF